MKKIALTTIFIFLLFNVNAQNKTITIWYTLVQKPSFVWDEYHYYFAPVDLAQDLSELLQKSTGISFAVKPYNGKSTQGIFLLLDSNKKYSANEAALINSDGKGFLTISAKYATGLSYGVYTYLEKLGFKFYLPGDNWTIIPARTTPFNGVIRNKEWKPWFKIRGSAISGTMYPVKDLDPERKNFKQWYKWYRRNRMGSEYMAIGGHIGELFNIEHKKEIEQDSLILAPVNGKRSFDVSGKLDPTYEKGINLFINWIIKQYKTENSLVPYYIPVKKYQSIDPGDGLNYCHSPECMAKYRSVSDQVFTIANRAAIKIKKSYPNAGVNSYAYTERADTPSIPLEPNIHIGIVANAFHNIATPIGLIERWAKKTKHVSIYDFLNIGVWNKDFPYFNLNSYVKFLGNIKKQQLEGFTFESGGSNLSSGIIQYFVLKYLCDPYTDIKKEFGEFCRLSFGEAANPVNKMMQEWYFSDVKLGTNYDEVTFNEVELGRFVNYLQQADGAVNLSTAQRRRLYELKAYTVYLAKYHEMKSDQENIKANKKDPAFLKNRTDELLKFTWMLYPDLIFHNTQLNDVLKYNLAGDERLLQKWDYATSDIFKNITKDAVSNVNSAFNTIYKKYSGKGTAEFMDPDIILAKAYLQRADTVKIKLIDASAFVNHRYALQVYCVTPTKIRIRYEATPEKKNETKKSTIGFVAITKDDYSLHNEIALYTDKLKGEISFNLPAKGHYKLFFGQNNMHSFSYTILPGNSLYYINKNTIPMNGVLLQDDDDGKYNGNKYLAFYTGSEDSIRFGMIYPDCVNYVKLYNSEGQQKVLNTDQAPFNIALKLTATEKNTFMFFSNGLFRWPPAFKNISPYYFFLKTPSRLK